MSPPAPIDELLVDALPGDCRVGLLADGQLIELKIDRGDGRGRPGAVLLGRVVRVTAGAAFLDIGGERPGLMDRRRGAAPVHEGEIVLVQVEKAPIDRKGAGLSPSINLPGRLLVLCPHRDGIMISRRLNDTAERERLAGIMQTVAAETEGFILRHAAAGAAAEDLTAEAEGLRAAWRRLLKRQGSAQPPALVDPGLSLLEQALLDHADSLARVAFSDRQMLQTARQFCARRVPDLAQYLVLDEGAGPLLDRDDVGAQVDSALARRVEVAGGGNLLIESGETLTAIDINTGPLPTGRNPEERWLEAGLAKVADVARQIRLRNIGGLIVVDFPRLRDRDSRDRLVAAMRDAVADDPVSTDVLGMSAGGLVEMTRRRRLPPLHQILRRPCPECDATGRLARPSSVAFDALWAARRAATAAPGSATAIIAAPAVIAAFDGVAAEALAAVQAELGRDLELRPDAAHPLDRFEIVNG